MDAFGRIRAGVSALKHELPISLTEPRSDEHHLAASMEWIYRSQDVGVSDGSAATYNLVLGWEDAYPETTGYIIPTLYLYSKVMGKPGAADRAYRMADWLETIQDRTGYFTAGTGENGNPSVFNTGQIVFGLVSAYRETGEKRYQAATRKACDWLVEQQTDGGFWDEYDYKNQVHTYSTRVAWALLEGGTIVQDRNERYRAAARDNLQWAVGLQQQNNWFGKASFEVGSAPYLHTIAYTIRGLLEAGWKLENTDVLDAAIRTADTLLSIQQQDGILKGEYDTSWSPSWYYCLTGNAQMAIIWLRLFTRTEKREYWSAARETVEFLKRRQITEGVDDIYGGLAGSYPVFGSYMYFRFPNWAPKFLADALLLANGYQLSKRA